MKNEIVKIHGTEFLCPKQEDEIYVAIKPACELLGINHSNQIRNLKNDTDFFGSVVVNMTTTGSDGKIYEMVCLPLQFFFGWLAQIDHNRVKEDVKPKVIAYKKEVCNVLYNHFMGAQKFLEEKEKVLEQLEKEVNEANRNFYTAKSTLKKIRDKMGEVINLSYEQYKANGIQLELFKEIEEIN